MRGGYTFYILSDPQLEAIRPYDLVHHAPESTVRTSPDPLNSCWTRREPFAGWTSPRIIGPSPSWTDPRRRESTPLKLS